ncbi:MAG TPA: xanthine phosphoribosyltransferase [Synergistales bacterium]|nr:xanthine phosphoribosyltransferase [Synergistales bacterium]
MDSSERYKKTFPISWDQLHRDCKALAWRLHEKGRWNRILAIARGGLVPAAIIARELDIHFIDTLCVSSYTLRTQGEPAILKLATSFGNDPQGSLIIDDLVDTGRTAQLVRRMFPEACFATVYAKPEGRPLVDLFITEVSQDTWILFPWDSEFSFSQPIIGRT